MMDHPDSQGAAGRVPVVYSPGYLIDIGGHVFATLKYARLFEALEAAGLLDGGRVVEPLPASWEELGLVHTADYLRKLQVGGLSPREVQTLEIPWSPAIVDGFRLMAGGTIAAARLALEAGIAVHLGGGLHHAHADHGEGFCMFNDVAVATRVLQKERLAKRAAVVDCDVHQGNGTAAVFAGDPSVFTLSLHQGDIYPFFKPASDLDVELPAGVGDEAYLGKLGPAVDAALASAPDVVFYLAGADPYREDQLGGMALTKEGLRRRDALVLSAARAKGVPVVVTLAGGYARSLEDLVAIHAATVREAIAIGG